MAAAKVFKSQTTINGKAAKVTSNRKGASKGKVIKGASGRVIGRSSPGRVTTFKISTAKARAGGSKG